MLPAAHASCTACWHLVIFRLRACWYAQAKSNSGPGSSSVHGSKNPRSTWGQSRVEDLSLDTALRLYDLERMEVLWERRYDTMALIAWGANRIVVVFRGTNSLKNILADLEVMLIVFVSRSLSAGSMHHSCTELCRPLSRL